eukprot:1157966-Pelagomonas_calceolata.AAC.6
MMHSVFMWILQVPCCSRVKQDDVEHHSIVPSIGSSAVAVMGTREQDWEQVEKLYKIAPNKVIPCFGVHPWFAHLHAATSSGSGGDSAEGQSASICQNFRKLWKEHCMCRLQTAPVCEGIESLIGIGIGTSRRAAVQKPIKLAAQPASTRKTCSA